MRQGLEEEELKDLKHSKTLSTSIQDDKIRREVDAAKKRAAAQNVDYPTFAAMVSVAHLQPVDRKSMASAKTVPSWSFSSSGDLIKLQQGSDQTGKIKQEAASKDEVLKSLEKLRSISLKESEPNREFGVSTLKDAAAPSSKVPLTGEAFRKAWSSLAREPPLKKLEFLSSLSPAAFQGVFKVEIPQGTLGEILESLCAATAERTPGGQSESDDEAEEKLARRRSVLDILDSISKCSRFVIAVKLVKQEKKGSCLVDQLFHSLRPVATPDNDNSQMVHLVEELRSKFLGA